LGIQLNSSPDLEPLDVGIRLVRNLATEGVIPVILYIEDLHDASESIVELITGLLGHPGTSVFIITTAWTGELDAKPTLSALQRWADVPNTEKYAVYRARLQEGFRAQDTKSFEQLPIQYAGLTSKEKHTLIQQYYPNASEQQTSSIINKIEQPLLLILVLRELKVQGVVSLGELSDQAIDKLPASQHEFYDHVWKKLPNTIQTSLLYSLLGIPHVINENYAYP